MSIEFVASAFSNCLLNTYRAAARRAGLPVPKITVYKYPGFSRGDNHLYQVYFEFGKPAPGEPGKARLHIAGDFRGYDASEAKAKALAEYVNAWGV